MTLREMNEPLGFKDGFDILNIGFKEMDMLSFLDNISKNFEFPPFIPYSKDIDFIKVSEKYMKELFEIQKVPYCPKEISDQALEEKEEILGFLNFVSNIKFIDPYNLPIVRTDDVKNVHLDIAIAKAGNNIAYACAQISLPGFQNYLKGSTYNHEIMHSQVTNSGKTTNYWNVETFSMFVEFLTLLNIDKSHTSYYFWKQFRIQEMQESYKYLLKNNCKGEQDHQIKASAYIVSGLKSNHLLEKYLNGSDSTKQKIIDSIQSVLEGKQTVEDILDNFAITYENSCNPDLLKRTLYL